MEDLLRKISKDYPQFNFRPGSTHCWSPQKCQITYNVCGGADAIIGIMHELGHAELSHTSYGSDIELLQKEVDAWQAATRIAKTYGITLSEERIQDCLDTYRDWLYKRSRCPNCSGSGIQQTPDNYNCTNCFVVWRVGASRLRRPYRQQNK